MRTHAVLSLLAAPLLLVTAGCNLPGKPAPGPEVPRPDAVLSFDTLYGDNCAGCHGAKGAYGAATDLANPEYEALIDDATLRNVIAHGQKGSLMPGFAISDGGELTDQQIDVLVKGMRQRWSKPNPFGGATPPPYKATHAGDATKGQAVYAEACASCHGATAQKPGKAGSILDGSFLALIDEQKIRTTVIAGRPDIGEPDWRNHIPGRPMTDDEITNVSAWLLAQKPAMPGQPYPSAQGSMAQPSHGQPQTAKH